MASQSSLCTCMRTYSIGCAPSGVHCICYCLTVCSLTTWLIVDSVNTVLICLHRELSEWLRPGAK